MHHNGPRRPDVVGRHDGEVADRCAAIQIGGDVYGIPGDPVPVDDAPAVRIAPNGRVAHCPDIVM